jgi:hypothetical protein
VFTGDLSRLLLESPRLEARHGRFMGRRGRDYIGDSGDWHSRLSDDKQKNFAKGRNAVKQFNGQAFILPLPSHKAADESPDASLDFVFIDADHSYEGCKRDLHVWSRKLKARTGFSRATTTPTRL